MSRRIIEDCLDEILRGGGDPEILDEAPPADKKSPEVQFGPWDYSQEIVDWEKIKAEMEQEQEAARETT